MEKCRITTCNIYINIAKKVVLNPGFFRRKEVETPNREIRSEDI
jgi:hypothetical protein